jgi:hypothetical protein
MTLEKVNMGAALRQPRWPSPRRPSRQPVAFWEQALFSAPRSAES